MELPSSVKKKRELFREPIDPWLGIVCGVTASESRRTIPRGEPAWHRNVGPISLSPLLGVMPTARNAP